MDADLVVALVPPGIGGGPTPASGGVAGADAAREHADGERDGRSVPAERAATGEALLFVDRRGVADSAERHR